MDPLSIAASIAGLIALTGTVVQYLSAVTEATEARGRLLLEVGAARGLLHSLKDLCELADVPPACFISLKSLCAPQGPFDQFKASLEQLGGQLAPKKGFAKVRIALNWTLDKDEVKSLMETMERQKMYFGLALQGNNL